MQLKLIFRTVLFVLMILLSFFVLTASISANEISLSGQFLVDKTATIPVPGISLLLDIWRGTTLSASVKADTISSASPSRSTTADVVSSASQYEVRKVGSLSIKQKLGSWTAGLGGYYSSEPDYSSVAFSFDIMRELAQKSATLSFSGNYGSDDISSVDDSSFQKSSSRLGFTLAYSQILNPKTIFKLSGSYVNVSGYQSSPYRDALRDAAFPAFDNTEVLPGIRNRFALASRINFYLEPIKGALHLGYRYYWDDWGIESHELDTKLYKYLSQQLFSFLHLRFYTQSAADYYRSVFTTKLSYMTSYYKYADGYTAFVSLGGRYKFADNHKEFPLSILNGITINGEVGYYYRAADDNQGFVGQIGLSWEW